MAGRVGVIWTEQRNGLRSLIVVPLSWVHQQDTSHVGP